MIIECESDVDFGISFEHLFVTRGSSLLELLHRTVVICQCALFVGFA